MKFRLFLCALLATAVGAFSAPITLSIESANKRINEKTVKFPAGSSLFMEAGSTLDLSGSTITGFTGGLPSMGSQSGKVLTNNGTAANWADVKTLIGGFGGTLVNAADAAAARAILEAPGLNVFNPFTAAVRIRANPGAGTLLNVIADTGTASGSAIEAGVGDNTYAGRLITARDFDGSLLFGVDRGGTIEGIFFTGDVGGNAATATVANQSLRPFVAKTANYTVLAGDDTIYANAAGGSFTITLPAPAAALVGATSHCYRIKRVDTSGNTVSVVVTGGVLMDTYASLSLAPWQSVDLQTNGTLYFIH